jgi:hypothetical protein
MAGAFASSSADSVAGTDKDATEAAATVTSKDDVLTAREVQDLLSALERAEDGDR